MNEGTILDNERTIITSTGCFIAATIGIEAVRACGVPRTVTGNGDLVRSRRVLQQIRIRCNGVTIEVQYLDTFKVFN